MYMKSLIPRYRRPAAARGLRPTQRIPTNRTGRRANRRTRHARRRKRPRLPGHLYRRIPAADVPGIAVTLTLGPDGRYTEVNRYCERPGQFTDYGRYTVRGNILTLRPDSPKDIPAYYRVGENRLWRLDSHQQPITGPFADQYILTKSDSATPAGCY